LCRNFGGKGLDISGKDNISSPIPEDPSPVCPRKKGDQSRDVGNLFTKALTDADGDDKSPISDPSVILDEDFGVLGLLPSRPGDLAGESAIMLSDTK